MNQPLCTYHTTYPKWRSMHNRCNNDRDKSWPKYGGRGITVCIRWFKFENFYADMGEPPPGTTLERRKNHLGYSKANCIWATHKEQANNRRSNRPITFQGKTQNISQWAEELGLGYALLYARLVTKAWTVKRALTTKKRGSL